MEEKRFKTVSIITIIFLILFSACGGGTHGTGGSVGRLSLTNGSGISGAKVSVAGQSGAVLTDASGFFNFSLNNNKQISLINFEVPNVGDVSIYVDTQKTNAENTPIDFILNETTRDVDAKVNDEDDVDEELEEEDCEEITEFWQEIVNNPEFAREEGFSRKEVNRIRNILNNDSLSCGEQLDRIDDIFFDEEEDEFDDEEEEEEEFDDEEEDEEEFDDEEEEEEFDEEEEDEEEFDDEEEEDDDDEEEDD